MMDNPAPDKSGNCPPPAEVQGDNAVPVAELAPATDPSAVAGQERAEETDVWYGSYTGLAMIPRLLQLLMLSILILVMAWYFGAWNGVSAVRLGAFTIICLLWLTQSIFWLRRAVGFNYRLTTRHLYYQQGFGHPGQPGIELDRITQVLVEASRAERWLDVGRIRVYCEGTSAPVVLDGVRHPFHVAKQIRRRLRGN